MMSITPTSVNGEVIAGLKHILTDHIQHAPCPSTPPEPILPRAQNKEIGLQHFRRSDTLQKEEF